jgi:hypothetical protein
MVCLELFLLEHLNLLEILWKMVNDNISKTGEWHHEKQYYEEIKVLLLLK